MSRRPSICGLEQKLRAALLELKASREFLISERDDHKTEIRSVTFMNTKLKGELTEMNVKCNDLTDQRDRLQVLVNEMDTVAISTSSHYCRFKRLTRRMRTGLTKVPCGSLDSVACDAPETMSQRPRASRRTVWEALP
ncbi:hypothetical protein EVAR_74861_1 [Eumeta japonica]|uniref:Uncharacterized protein n=1 Tax=Eumeta variegata TaxID=151549 RepID=A0A4C1SS24_EUMVA|nr:hypothetical protein EVAR_74861_1 [Eumeta japonica]